jgi:hypothetical protein
MLELSCNKFRSFSTKPVCTFQTALLKSHICKERLRAFFKSGKEGVSWWPLLFYLYLDILHRNSFKDRTYRNIRMRKSVINFSSTTATVSINSLWKSELISVELFSHLLK